MEKQNGKLSTLCKALQKKLKAERAAAAAIPVASSVEKQKSNAFSAVGYIWPMVYCTTVLFAQSNNW